MPMDYPVREHLAAIVDSSSDAIISKDLNGIVTSWNPGAEVIFGYTAGEAIGMPITRLIPDAKLLEEATIIDSIRRGERVQLPETQRLAKDRRLIDVSITLAPIRDRSGTIVGASKIARDITLLKEREREVERLSRLYAALSRINQAIVHTRHREELFHEVCHALVEQGSFAMAWIGWQDPAACRLVPIASCGDKQGYLNTIKVFTDERLEGLGPTGTAFRSGHPYVCNDLSDDPKTAPWRTQLEVAGYRSSVALPIRMQGKVCAALSVYSTERNSFHDKELSLLREAASDLSFALDNFLLDEARRQAEQQWQSEKRFSDTMIESLPGAVYFYDDTGRFLRWNRNFESVTGYSAQEIAGMHPLDFFKGDDRQLLEQRIAEVFDKGESSVEADFIAKSGHGTPYFFTGRRVEFDGKRCLLGMGVDISEHRQAERRLADSERQYRELVEHANSIILRWNSAGIVTFLNEFGLRFFGYTAEEIVGRHVVGTIVPLTESGGRDLTQLMADICAAPEAFEQNLNENVRRDGERVWVAWTNRIVRDAQGNLLEILSIGTDVTARKQAEDAQRESESRYRKLFEYAPDGILITDSHSRCLDANASICRMLGYSREELIGKKHLSELLTAEGKELFRREFHVQLSPAIDDVKQLQSLFAHPR